MKRVLIIFILLLIAIPIWYGESRNFSCTDSGKCVTVWKTYNNVCYVIPDKYYGLLKPSSRNYIKTTNKSLGVDLIWTKGSDTIIAQVDGDSQIINNVSNKTVIANYQSNEKYNDSIYTFFFQALVGVITNKKRGGRIRIFRNLEVWQTSTSIIIRNFLQRRY